MSIILTIGLMLGMFNTPLDTDWDWVLKNVEYIFDQTGVPVSSEELEETLQGDCEDVAFYIARKAEGYGYENYVLFLYNRYSKKVLGHAYALVKKPDGHWYYYSFGDDIKECVRRKKYKSINELLAKGFIFYQTAELYRSDGYKIGYWERDKSLSYSIEVFMEEINLG